ncbi:hypothetical protein BDQ17DRAFT_1386147 [Cyathus striatus]|nr:hypothetical protein BDQ17DRAFT_1386147 [Cyathus striatus]
MADMNDRFPPQSHDFDVGLNTSVAWTSKTEPSLSQGAMTIQNSPESISNHRMLSGDVIEVDVHHRGQTAWAIYPFAGQVKFQELSKLEAGDELNVLQENIGEGRSLVRTLGSGETGLLPVNYYTAPSESSPVDDPLSSSPGNIAPSLSRSILLQTTTSEWIRAFAFPSFRQSILGGKSLNRSSKSSNEVDRHYIDVGPAWTEKIPAIKILVHSPEKRIAGTNSFIMYTITTFFQCDSSKVPGSYPLTVYRRFSHFNLLNTILLRRLPAIALPPLPEKQYTGKESKDFIEARRAGHPVIRYADIFTLFLSCDNDSEWHSYLAKHSSLPSIGASFFANVYHPAFNIDVQDAEAAEKGFYAHIKANSLGIQCIRNIFSNIRDARIDLTLNTWCWRGGCKECLKLSKGIQLTAESLHSVADLYDDHARRTQLATHEYLKKMAHPDRIYEGVVATHESTLSRYRATILNTRQSTEEGVLSRCETVLNTTMAEMEVYHQQKLDEFHALTLDHLDGEISFYEKVLNRLKTSRRRLSGTAYDELADSPRPTSRYERELDRPRWNATPLPQPYPHVFD